LKAVIKRIGDKPNYIDQIRDLCGDLCDIKKNITPADFMGSVKAKVDCDALFAIDLIEMPVSEPPPPTWAETEDIYKYYLSHDGLVDISEWHLDSTMYGDTKTLQATFTEEGVNNYISQFLSTGGLPIDGSYAGASQLVNEAAEFVNVSGKTILVIGSQDPWLEAVLLSRNASKIVTVEYGLFISEHPAWEIIFPKEFNKRYLNGTLPTFDAIFSYSSLEHSGLGRYGDSLNPWAEIITIAQAWCVSKPDARLVLGVPTYMNGRDRIEFNAGKVFGPILYPYMVTNWGFIWPHDDNKRIMSEGSIVYQPLFVFKKL